MIWLSSLRDKTDMAFQVFENFPLAIPTLHALCGYHWLRKATLFCFAPRGANLCSFPRERAGTSRIPAFAIPPRMWQMSKSIESNLQKCRTLTIDGVCYN